MAKINCRGNNGKKSPTTTPKTSKDWIPAKNAERERSRVKLLRNAFQLLQSCLPSVPPDTKLSKLDILILATNYITILMKTLNNDNGNNLNDGVNHHHQQQQQHHLTLSSEVNYQSNNHCNTLIATNLDSSKKSNQSLQLENQFESSSSSSIKVYRPIKKWPMRSRLYSMIHCYNNNNINNNNDN